MLRVGFLGVILLLAIWAGSLVSSGASAQSQDPTAVIAAYESARNNRDIEGALGYFADDATVSQRQTSFVGKAQIRQFLQGSVTRVRFVVVQDAHASGDVVTWTERTAGLTLNVGAPQPIQQQQPSGGQAAQVGTGSFGFQRQVEAVVQDGKIKALAYNGAGEASAVDLVRDSRPQLPAVLGLGSVLAVLVGLVGVGSSGWGRPPATASSLQGRLVAGLQGWTAARD